MPADCLTDWYKNTDLEFVFELHLHRGTIHSRRKTIYLELKKKKKGLEVLITAELLIWWEVVVAVYARVHTNDLTN